MGEKEESPQLQPAPLQLPSQGAGIGVRSPATSSAKGAGGSEDVNAPSQETSFTQRPAASRPMLADAPMLAHASTERAAKGGGGSDPSRTLNKPSLFETIVGPLSSRLPISKPALDQDSYSA